MDGGEVIPDELVVLILSHSDMSTKGKFLSLSKKWNSEANRNMNFSVKQHGRDRIEVLKDKDIELEKVFRRNNMGEEYLSTIRWYKDGYKHKGDGPAEIGWYPNGMKSHEFWYYNGNFYRKQSRSESGPTKMQWWPNGRPQMEEWIKNKKFYRKDKTKPFKTEWNINGYKQLEVYPEKQVFYKTVF